MWKEMPVFCTNTGAISVLTFLGKKGKTSTGKLETAAYLQSPDDIWEIAPKADHS